MSADSEETPSAREGAMADPGKMLTVRQLAQRLKLGKTTIALALRDSPKVSAATRKWVQEQARELGYVPNTVASAFLQHLRSRGTKPYRANLAFIGPKRISPFIKGALQGAQERARELGYGLDVLTSGEFTGTELGRMLLARGISGLIIGPLQHAVGHLTLDWSKFAVVACGYSMVQPAVHRVVHNHLHGIRTAFRMCLKKGFRRVGLAISADSDFRSDRQWSCGFLGMQQALPPKDQVKPMLVPHARYRPQAILEWIAKEKPEVMIIHATGCVPGLAAMLREAPVKVRCVVLDRVREEPYAGIDQKFRLTGRMLVDSVSAQILYNQRGIPEMPVVSSVDGAWVDHPSLG